MARATIVEAKAARQRIIERPRLTQLLDESEARILLLLAPAGYGKTTLAHQWLSRSSRQSAWYQGTPASADVAALASALAETCSELVPGAGTRMRERLKVSKTSEADTETLASLLAADLTEWPSDAWLVIDDYQFVLARQSADRFVDQLVAHSSLQLLITSRERPRWATARRSIYGELYEVGRESLALEPDEAAAILQEDPDAITELINRAEGWPAVIGLAAQAKTIELPSQSIASLHRYFAEELYQALEPGDRWLMCCLSVMPDITTDLAARVLGEAEARRALAEATRVGFLVPSVDARFILHPLLRDFLVDKFLEDGGDRAVVDRLVRELLTRRSFDEALMVIELAKAGDLLESLVAQALDSTLRAGRVATVARWTELAKHYRLDSPVVDLAEAELAFRHGACRKSETTALSVARRLDATHSLTSRAYYLAGQSAHLNNRHEDALRSHRAALRSAKSLEESVQALWGEFISRLELEDECALDALAQLEALCDGTPDQVVRLVSGRVFAGHRLTGITDPRVGGVQGVFESFRLGFQLLEDVEDPVIRSSFLNICAHILTSLGEYSAALQRSDEALRDAEAKRLDFVLPYAHLSRAGALLGLRRFRLALQALKLAERLNSQAGDPHVITTSLALRTKILLSQRRIVDAVAVSESDWGQAPTPGSLAERLVVRALSLACAECGAEALALADEASSLTHEREIAAIATLTRLIVLLQGEHTTRELSHHVARLRDSGYVNPFVLAYRSFPPLLFEIAKQPSHHPFLVSVLSRARDEALARRAGIDLRGFQSPPSTSSGRLSRREGEVYLLLAQGLSNQEIAEALWISQATVKAHTRHIFEKLGVRSRTEAAALANEPDLKDLP